MSSSPDTDKLPRNRSELRDLLVSSVVGYKTTYAEESIRESLKSGGRLDLDDMTTLGSTAWAFGVAVSHPDAMPAVVSAFRRKWLFHDFGNEDFQGLLYEFLTDLLTHGDYGEFEDIADYVVQKHPFIPLSMRLLTVMRATGRTRIDLETLHSLKESMEKQERQPLQNPPTVV